MIANGLAGHQGYGREGEQGAQCEPEFARPGRGRTTPPGQSVCDHVILLPGIFLLACRNQSHNSTRIFRVLFAMGAALLLWPWLAAVGLVILRPFLRPELFYSRALLALPLRTAASFPFVVLALLVVAIRATAHEPPELLAAPCPG